MLKPIKTKLILQVLKINFDNFNQLSKTKLVVSYKGDNQFTNKNFQKNQIFNMDLLMKTSTKSFTMETFHQKTSFAMSLTKNANMNLLKE